jgi:hypothetical protein
MSRNIRITFKDATVRVYNHQGRAGGSYTKTLILKEGWAKVVDEWNNVEAFPADTIVKVEEREYPF